MLGLSALAATVTGRITDGSHGLAGVTVYPDRVVRVRSLDLPPVAVTDGDGRFTLEVAAQDTVLAVEKSGWERDLVPLAELSAPVALRPAPNFSRERVLALRLDLQGVTPLRSDAELRAILFSRRPGEASAANYYYEISKGSLELEEGAIRHLDHTAAPILPNPYPPRYLIDQQRQELSTWALDQIKDLDLAPYDQVDDRTGAPGADGKPDHLFIIPPGPSRNITLDPAHFAAICFMLPLPGKPGVSWPVEFFSEETPLGNIVHEGIHAMGEFSTGDFYMDCAHPLTAGKWDIMDAGQFQGWDRMHPDQGPWQEDTAYSPAQPMGWTRSELWYRGRFRATVTTLAVAREWEGWMDPLERAPRQLPQRLVVADPRGRGKAGRFWEFNVRRPWGYDRGRTGNQWGPGYEGLVVARINPALNVAGKFLGPVRVLQAHPDAPEPPLPRHPCGRWQLDSAAFNLGPGEMAAGSDGPLHWQVLEVDPAGRMRVRVSLDSGQAGARAAHGRRRQRTVGGASH
jgi:hypothetical protein